MLNFPPSCVGVVCDTLRRERMDLETLSLTNRTRFPRLEGLQWRVDVAISSSSLLRVFRPSIVMQMALSDGRMVTFDVSVEQFHQLRYNVAKVLRDMQVSSCGSSGVRASHLASSLFFPRYLGTREAPHHAHRRRSSQEDLRRIALASAISELFFFLLLFVTCPSSSTRGTLGLPRLNCAVE